MSLEKLVEAENWDGSIITVKLKDISRWVGWNDYNKRNQIHPTQKEFTEVEWEK